jgi:hypothetical protein
MRNQGSDRLWAGWAAGLSSCVCPVTGDEVGVPAQQDSGRHQSQAAQLGGQQPAQRAEVRPVDPGQRWVRVGSAQYGELVSEHQDLDVLGSVRAGEERQPAQRADEHQVGESESHSERSCWPGSESAAASAG